jgi:hypothetical protein
MAKNYTLEKSRLTGGWSWQCKDGSGSGTAQNKADAKKDAEAKCGKGFALVPPDFDAEWTNPVYAVQVFTGVVVLGSILVADKVTAIHILLAVIAFASVVVSLLATAHAEADSNRTRQYLETLLRSIELPYFIIKALTDQFASAAHNRAWTLTFQENFESETVYMFESTTKQSGRLVISQQEFKDLWLLNDRARADAINVRLFGDNEPSIRAEVLQNQMGEVVREAIAKLVPGPHWIAEPSQPNGARAFLVSRTKAGPGKELLCLSQERQQELLAMTPLARYDSLAKMVRHALQAGGDVWTDF